MKFTVSMKDPDTLDDAIADAVKSAVNEMPDLDDEEREAVQEKRQGTIRELASKWFEYGEYLRVEIDTVAKTCTVLPVAR